MPPTLIGDTGVFPIVAKILQDVRLLEVMQENAKLKTRIATLEHHMDEKRDMFFELVAHARHDTLASIEHVYPKEVNALQEDETGFWQHGFNSGGLAVCRLFQSILHAEEQAKLMQEEEEEPWGEGEWSEEDEIEQALEDYPFLDT